MIEEAGQGDENRASGDEMPSGVTQSEAAGDQAPLSGPSPGISGDEPQPLAGLSGEEEDD